MRKAALIALLPTFPWQKCGLPAKRNITMLRKIRIIVAAAVFACITLLFLDFTGAAHKWLSFLASLQAFEAVLAVNFAVIVLLAVVTFLFGRVYCSVICPLGIMQDIIDHFGSKRHKTRFSYRKANNWLRYGFLAATVLLLVLGLASIASLVAPYATFGRIATELLAPVYNLGNNLLAYISGRAGSYAFYPASVWMKSLPTFIAALVALVVLAFLARRNGRIWCNTVCPVGTVLGFISRYSVFRHKIDTSKCTNCGICARKCKSSCINPENHTIDGSRCVACFNCIDACSQNAISYSCTWKGCCSKDKTACDAGSAAAKESAKAAAEATTEVAAEATTAAKTADAQAPAPVTEAPVAEATAAEAAETAETAEATESNTADTSRRAFMTGGLLAAASLTLGAQKRDVDGGLAILEEKKIPRRNTPVKPAGSQSLAHFGKKCVACQLCVTKCPSGVLRPSTSLQNFMQPEMGFEKGFCRTSCTTCSQVCPTGAIGRISVEEKSSIRIGHAVTVPENCLPNTKGVKCGNCERHCPTGAIVMVDNGNGGTMPAVDTQKCIGCGSCEYHCPARPFSAIYVEGHLVHSQL